MSYYDAVPAPAHDELVVNRFTNQNIILTINHATPIKINHTAACLRTINHLLYWSSFPEAVTIRNPPYSTTISAISPSIHNIRFTAHLITFTNPSAVQFSVFTRSILPAHHGPFGSSYSEFHSYPCAFTSGSDTKLNPNSHTIIANHTPRSFCIRNKLISK